MFPISFEARCFDSLSCIISPLSKIGIRRERLGASIAWTKLVSSSTFIASFKYTFGLLSALTSVSRISAISGHLITDPMF